MVQVSKALGCGCNLINHFLSFKQIKLKQKQRDLHSDDLNSVQDVVTRWNCSYYMVECIIQLQQPLCAALIETRTDLMMEISIMEIFMEVFEPVVEIAEAIGCEKSVIILIIRPLLYKLLSQKLLENLSDKPLA